jgi:hypothetical protein
MEANLREVWNALERALANKGRPDWQAEIVTSAEIFRARLDECALPYLDRLSAKGGQMQKMSRSDGVAVAALRYARNAAGRIEAYAAAAAWDELDLAVSDLNRARAFLDDTPDDQVGPAGTPPPAA